MSARPPAGSQPPQPSGDARNRRLALTLAGVVVAMVGLAFASVPLYDLFCRVTGYGGTTQRADAAPGQAIATSAVRTFRIRFNADVNPDLPWSFRPGQTEMTVKAGEEHLAFYQATNDSGKPVVGTAVYNVSPPKVGAYFNKIQCFCFTKQRLEPGETMDMPVSFFVDPEISQDPNLSDVTTITLSYTFYPDPESGDQHATLRTGN